MAPDRLKKKVAELPTTPGVYLFKDARGVVLYVGKAKSLRARVSSYFHDAPSDTRAKIPGMMEQVADLEIIEAASEVDALLMEARLVKDIQPKYNESLRDGKLYPYVEVTRGNDFPGVYVTRQRDNPRSKFYGPFTDVRGLRHALNLLQRIFRFRTCQLEIDANDPKRRFQRPCLLHYIERCTAPCADRVSRDDYREQIGLFQRFLDGKRKRVIKALTDEMEACAKALKFERAGLLRDQLRAMEALAKRGTLDIFHEAVAPPVVDADEGLEELRRIFNLPELPRSIEGIDASNIQGDCAVASVVTFLNGKPFKPGYRRFRIKSVIGVNDYAAISETVERRYLRLDREETPFPDILLIDGGKGHLKVAQETLARLGITLPKVVSIAKREELLYTGDPPEEIRLKRNSAALRIFQYVRDEAHRFAVHYHRMLRGKKMRSDR